MSSPIWHTFSFNLCLSIVRTCSNRTTESFARSYRLESISTCVGSFALFILLVIAAIWRVGQTAYDFAYHVVSDAAVDPEPGRDVKVSVTSDMGNKEIAKLLESRGLITDSRTFQIQLKLTGYDDKLKPGTYELNTSMTPRRIMKILAGEEKTEEDEES